MTDETEKVDNANAVEPVRRLTNRQKICQILYRRPLFKCGLRGRLCGGQCQCPSLETLNRRDFPLVVEHIAEEREARERKWGDANQPAALRRTVPQRGRGGTVFRCNQCGKIARHLVA